MSFKQAIIIRTDLKMQRGKIASQASHASVTAAYKTLQKNPDKFKKWYNSMAKIILKVGSEKELLKIAAMARSNKLVTEVIRDAGRTQIAPGTITALGIGPDEDEKIDKVIKDLKLL